METRREVETKTQAAHRAADHNNDFAQAQFHELLDRVVTPPVALFPGGGQAATSGARRYFAFSAPGRTPPVSTPWAVRSGPPSSQFPAYVRLRVALAVAVAHSAADAAAVSVDVPTGNLSATAPFANVASALQAGDMIARDNMRVINTKHVRTQNNLGYLSKLLSSMVEKSDSVAVFSQSATESVRSSHMMLEQIIPNLSELAASPTAVVPPATAGSVPEAGAPSADTRV